MISKEVLQSHIYLQIYEIVSKSKWNSFQNGYFALLCHIFVSKILVELTLNFSDIRMQFERNLVPSRNISAANLETNKVLFKNHSVEM